MSWCSFSRMATPLIRTTSDLAAMVEIDRMCGVSPRRHVSYRTACRADFHPTVKPIALVADAILDCTSRDDIVYNPFLGSGTSILAAEKVGRRGYGIEIDPLYVDASIRRWQSFTRRDAILSENDRTFDEVAASRVSRVRSVR